MKTIRNTNTDIQFEVTLTDLLKHEGYVLAHNQKSLFFAYKSIFNFSLKRSQLLEELNRFLREFDAGSVAKSYVEANPKADLIAVWSELLIQYDLLKSIIELFELDVKKEMVA